MKELESGRTTVQVCQSYGISNAAYYKWKPKNDIIEMSDILRLKELKDENRRLKQMYLDQSPEDTALKDVDALSSFLFLN